jgi:hypothetical protein
VNLEIDCVLDRFQLLTDLEAKMNTIKTHRELKVYQLSFEADMEIFRTSKLFPRD